MPVADAWSDAQDVSIVVAALNAICGLRAYLCIEDGLRDLIAAVRA
jgi:hypothetical protein